MVSSTLGWSTMMGWKRRSSAPSFSMYLRYSSSVVAPMHCSSPRASAGFSMFEASIAPSAPPAPTMVWSSSMKITVSLDSRISFMTVLSRSSNWPRYLVPATTAARSSVTMRLFLRLSGTWAETMRWARPSAIAVLPTPGSPISTGLFFLRRDSTWMTRSISLSRPITGSSLPSRASWVRSRPNWLSAGVSGRSSRSPVEELEGVPPSSFSVSSRTRLRSTPSSSSTLAATPSPSRISPSSRCSVPT